MVSRVPLHVSSHQDCDDGLPLASIFKPEVDLSIYSDMPDHRIQFVHYFLPSPPKSSANDFIAPTVDKRPHQVFGLDEINF